MFELKITGGTPAELMANVAAYANGLAPTATVEPGAGVTITEAPASASIVDGAPGLEVASSLQVAPVTDVMAPVTQATGIAALPADIQDWAKQGEEAAELDSAGTPWDGRIHTSNKGVKKDGTWKRKPALPDGVYDSVLAEITAGATAAPVAGAIPATSTAATTAQTAPTLAPVATQVAPVVTAPAPAGGGHDLNTITAAITSMVTAATQNLALGGAIGADMMGRVLTAYGAVGASPDGVTPGMPHVAALDLAHYPALAQTCGALVANMASVTPQNYVAMIDSLLVRG